MRRTLIDYRKETRAAFGNLLASATQPPISSIISPPWHKIVITIGIDELTPVLDDV